MATEMNNDTGNMRRPLGGGGGETNRRNNNGSPQDSEQQQQQRQQELKQMRWIFQAYSLCSVFLAGLAVITVHASRSQYPVMDAFVNTILTSTPRLLAVSNLYLMLACQFHNFMADWLLLRLPGDASAFITSMTSFVKHMPFNFCNNKFLLMCAVLAPNTLDCLLLFAWFTTMGSLQSLVSLASAEFDKHLHAPPKGSLHLLGVVHLMDVTAAAGLMLLFPEVATLDVDILLALFSDSHIRALQVLGLIVQYFQVTSQHGENTISATSTLLQYTKMFLQITAYFTRIIYNLNIWGLHGIQFTWVDLFIGWQLYQALAGATGKFSIRIEIIDRTE